VPVRGFGPFIKYILLCECEYFSVSAFCARSFITWRGRFGRYMFDVCMFGILHKVDGCIILCGEKLINSMFGDRYLVYSYSEKGHRKREKDRDEITTLAHRNTSWGFRTWGFIIYQKKKPTISGAIIDVRNISHTSIHSPTRAHMILTLEAYDTIHQAPLQEPTPNLIRRTNHSPNHSYPRLTIRTVQNTCLHISCSAALDHVEWPSCTERHP